MTSREPTVEYAYNGNEAPSEAVVAAVAAASNRKPLEVGPLYEFVAPDALDAIFRACPTRDSEPGEVQIEFRIDADYVTVTADHVRVHSADEGRAD